MDGPPDLVLGPAPFQAVVFSKKGGGKSTFIRYVIHEYRNIFSYVIVISATSDVNGAYDFLPPRWVHTHWDPAIVTKLIKKQTVLFKRDKIQMMCVFDDIIGLPGLDFKKQKDNPLNLLFSANRHWGISLIVATQGVKSVPKLLRLNVDKAIFLRNLHQAQIDLHEEFGHMDRRKFTEWLTANTADHQMVIYTAAEADPSKAYSVFKVPKKFLDFKFRLDY